jgi:hypothetical protein
MVSLACVVALVVGVENRDLARGEELFNQYKWADARAALTKARTAKGLTREQLLRILELIGVAAAQQRQAETAQNAFIELLTLDPDHKLQADYAPRVMTPFLESRRLVDERGALSAAADAHIANGQVETVTVKLSKDALKLARSVRFNVGGKEKIVALTQGAASLAVSGAEVRWSADVLGENETQLLVIAPRVERAVQPEPEAPPPALQPKEVPVVVDEPAPTVKHSSAVRNASYAVLGIALVAAGAGAYFGVQSSSDYNQINNAMRSGMVITSITEHDAYPVVAQGKQYAAIADALFIGAGVAALVAVLMWSLGG